VNSIFLNRHHDGHFYFVILLEAIFSVAIEIEDFSSTSQLLIICKSFSS